MWGCVSLGQRNGSPVRERENTLGEEGGVEPSVADGG